MHAEAMLEGQTINSQSLEEAPDTLGPKSFGPINQPLWPTLSPNWISMSMSMSMYVCRCQPICLEPVHLKVGHNVQLNVDHHVQHHVGHFFSSSFCQPPCRPTCRPPCVPPCWPTCPSSCQLLSFFFLFMSATLSESITDLPMDWLTGVDARDACTSKNHNEIQIHKTQIHLVDTAYMQCMGHIGRKTVNHK